MKQHVLFVDDDPSFLDGLRRMVHDQRGRWEMTFVTSMDDAVECVGTRTVDTIVFADMICFTSPLHDFGTIGIPDDILLQPRALTPKEWDVMRRHCVIGADIFRQDVWVSPQCWRLHWSDRRTGIPEERTSSWPWRLRSP